VTGVLPPSDTPLGAWVRQRLRDDPIAWLTTIDSRGIAQPNPVWYVWEGDSVLIYNIATARRLANIRRRPDVTLHLDTYGRSGDSIVLIGKAEVVSDVPAANQHPEFMAKYESRMSMPAHRWAEMFPAALRIRVTRFRGFHNARPTEPGL
jgi:PPOX class probable F420-dependent enzyme